MIIDLILDRKDGQRYEARDFYWEVMSYSDIWPEQVDAITRAMDEGTEEDVRAALRGYLRWGGYNNPSLMDYVDSVTWL